MKGERKMEKITKEELLNKLGGEVLSDDALEKVSGGIDCYDKCDRIYSGDSLIHCYDACDGK